MFKKIQALVSGGKKAFEYVKPKPKVNKTKLDKAMSDLNIELQKTKAVGAKLKQTKFEIENPKFRGKDFTFKKDKGKSESKKERFKRIQKQNTKVLKGVIDDAFKDKKAKGGRVGKMGGGMMGRRFGMKKGSKFPDLTGDGKVTFADILKGRGVINGKKKKK